MKNPFKKENFLRVAKESDSQDRIFPQIADQDSDLDYEKLRKKYEKLLKDYQRKPDKRTSDEINRIYKILTANQPSQIQSPKQSPVIHDKILDRAKEIASSYGKNFDELSIEKQNKLIEKADLELQGDEVLQSLMSEPEPDEEIEQLRTANEKLQQEIIQTQVVLGDMQRKIVDLNQLIEDKESEIKYIRTVLHEDDHQEPVENQIIENNVSSDSQIAYDMLQKNREKKSDVTHGKTYQLGDMELYCLSCKHKIQAHARHGESNGCSCGCLRTIEDIAKENKIPLITKKNYKIIHNGTKRESFISKNFMPKKETKIESIEDIPVSPSIIKQARALQSMVVPKKSPTKIEERAQRLQLNTQQKLKEESRRTKDLAEVSPDTCTCGHMMQNHFEGGGFCTEMDCPCDQFREYPQ